MHLNVSAFRVRIAGPRTRYHGTTPGTHGCHVHVNVVCEQNLLMNTEYRPSKRDEEQETAANPKSWAQRRSMTKGGMHTLYVTRFFHRPDALTVSMRYRQRANPGTAVL